MSVTLIQCGIKTLEPEFVPVRELPSALRARVYRIVSRRLRRLDSKYASVYRMPKGVLKIVFHFQSRPSQKLIRKLLKNPQWSQVVE